MLKVAVFALLCSLIMVQAAVAPPKDLSEFKELLEKDIEAREQEELAEREQEELAERELEEQRFFRRPSIGSVLSAMINLQVSMARTQKEHTGLLMQIIEMMNEEEEFVENAAADVDDKDEDSESESESGDGSESGSSAESGSSSAESGSSSTSGASSESGLEGSSGPSLPPTRRQTKWMRELEIIKKIADSLEHANQ